MDVAVLLCTARKCMTGGGGCYNITAEAVMVGRRLLVNMASATNAVYRGNALFLMY